MASIKGGDKLKAVLRKMSERLSDSSTVEVGFMPDATYEPNGTLVAMVAAIQEYGARSKNIPPRPFFRNMIKKESPHWASDVANQLKATNFDSNATLNEMGQQIKGELEQSIADTNDPALSQLTLMLRGMRAQARYRDLPFGELIAEAKKRVEAGKTNYGASTKALVDTGNMLDSVSFDVK